MKITVVTSKIPRRESGSEVRNYYILKALGKKYKLDIYYLKNDGLIDKKAFPFSNKISLSQLSFLTRLIYLLQGYVPYVQRLKNTEIKKDFLKNETGVLQLQELDSYFLVEKYLPYFKGKVILDTHNIDYLRFESEIKQKDLFNRLLGKLLTKKLKIMEIEAIKHADHVFVCSEEMFNIYARFIPKSKMTIVPNGVDCQYFSPSPVANNLALAFMGLLSYPPNERGIRYYLTQIHPQVKNRIQDVTISIVGKNPPQWLINMSQQDHSIKLIGFVKDVREVIKSKSICICPLLSGSGTRLKILEYMAMGKPIISTSKGAEGIAISNNKDIILADTPIKFANEVVRLLKHKNVQISLGKNARLLVEKEYDWNKIGEKVLSYYDQK